MRNAFLLGWIAAAVACGQVPAAAQPPSEVTGIVLHGDSSGQPASQVKPVATGKPHVCDDYYPQINNPVDGTTKLRFAITEKGDVVLVFIVQSSGSDRLDRAAVNCISAWKFQPTMVNDFAAPVRATVEIPWSASMMVGPTPEQKAYTREHPSYVSPKGIGKPHICMDQIPVELPQAGVQGEASIAFLITTDGKTKDVHITRSSGNEALDNAAVTCASAWLYTPAMEDGKPVEKPWAAKVELALH